MTCPRPSPGPPGLGGLPRRYGQRCAGPSDGRSGPRVAVDGPRHPRPRRLIDRTVSFARCSLARDASGAGGRWPRWTRWCHGSVGGAGPARAPAPDPCRPEQHRQRGAARRTDGPGSRGADTEGGLARAFAREWFSVGTRRNRRRATPPQSESGGGADSAARRYSALRRWASSSWSSRMMMRQAASMGVPWSTSSRARAAMRNW